ncbi:MAG: hypothetical protein QM753_08775 [Thermomicrobiales bacterium]
MTISSCRDRNGVWVTCSSDTWEVHVLYRHPDMDDYKAEVIQTITSPDAEFEDADYTHRTCFYSRRGIVPDYPDAMIKVVVEYTDGQGELKTTFLAETHKPGETLRWSR